MNDKYKSYPVNRNDPGVFHFAITPSDTEDLPTRPRALYVTVAGNLAMHDSDGMAITYPVEVGLMPFSPMRVLAAGTTATVVGWL